jgi:hypothetical protein
MSERCKHIEKNGFNCGSYAFNLYKEDIDQGSYCDRHYWQAKAQRTWVGLTEEEMTHTNHHMVEGAYQYSFKQGAKWAEAKLKEKNT